MHAVTMQKATETAMDQVATVQAETMQVVWPSTTLTSVMRRPSA